MGKGVQSEAGKGLVGADSEWRPSGVGERWKILSVISGIALLIVVIYGQVVFHEFVDWDDYGYFVESSALDGHLSWSDIRSAFTETHMANWSPLTSLTILAGDALHGPSPGAYLVGNVFLHFVASALLFLWLLRGTGNWLASSWVALVFAVHPLHVESVAWASERKDVLAGALWMGALVAYVLYSQRSSSRRFGAVVVLSALAALSKPTAVAIPVTLLLLDYWPLGRLRRMAELWPRLREKIVIIGVSLAVAVLTVLAQGEAGANSTTLLSWSDRVLNAGLSYWTYLAQSFWPRELAVFYPYPSSEVLSGWAPRAAWLLGIGLTGLTVWAAERRPYLLMGWFWFALTLVPMMGFVQVGGQAHADRYMFIPMVGLLVMVAWLLVESQGHRRWGTVAWGAAFLLVLTLVPLARIQASYWANTKTLFEHALEVTERNSIAHRHLGVAYWADGDREVGEAHLREAVRLSPQWGESRVALADALNQAGRFSEAQSELSRASGMGHESAALHAGWAVSAHGLGDHESAVREYRRAINDGLVDWQIMNNLAWLLISSSDVSLRNPEEAVVLAQRALELVPGNPDVLDTLNSALRASGRKRPID